MSIFVGSSDIDDIVIGTDKKESVFIGSNRVWVRPALYNVTVGVSGNQSGWLNTAGSIAYVSGHNAYQNDWFPNLAGVGQGNDIFYLFAYPPSAGTVPYKIQLTIGSTSTSASPTPNTDATFSSMTIDGTVFNRSDASYSYSHGSNFSLWLWDTTANPFGTTAGAVKRVRFDKP